MAIQDILPILDIMPDLLRNLPVLVQILQAIGYVVFILFLGSISIRGYRGYANWFFRFGVRVGLGFVALIGGIALSNVVPFLNEGVYRMFQLNVLIFGVISSIILLVAVYMIAFNIINVEGMRKQIENLQKRLEKARDVKAKKLAPISIVGIVILIGFVLFSALFFGGFPDMLSDVGLNPDDLSNLADEIEGLTGQVEDVPQGCVSMVVLAQSLGPGNLLNTSHEDLQAQAIIESETNSVVLQTYLVTYNQEEIIIGVTEDRLICSVKDNVFCECLAS